MDKLLPFLRARLAERSTRVQLVVLALLGLVSAGYLTIEQIHAWGAHAMAVVAAAGPLAGVLFPDKNHAIATEAQMDEAVNAALEAVTAAAEKQAGAKATEVAQVVGGVADKLGL